MPVLNFSQELTANQLGYNPLTGWEFETIPYQYVNGAVCKLLTNAEDVNVRLTINSGSQTIQTRSPVSKFATVGILPTDFDTPAVTWLAAPGDRLKLAFDEVAGGTPVVQGLLQVEPM